MMRITNVLIDRAWCDSLLATVAGCDTLEALQFLWRRWSADVANSSWRDELVEAKDARKEVLRGNN